MPDQAVQPSNAIGPKFSWPSLNRAPYSVGFASSATLSLAFGSSFFMNAASCANEFNADLPPFCSSLNFIDARGFGGVAGFFGAGGGAPGVAPSTGGAPGVPGNGALGVGGVLPVRQPGAPGVPGFGRRAGGAP